MLINYRPEYRHEWGSRTYYTQLRLDPLGAESAGEMLGTLLGSSADNPELAPLKRLIIEKTEGNPFFMEETVQVLLDGGALVRNGAIRLTNVRARSARGDSDRRRSRSRAGGHVARAQAQVQHPPMTVQLERDSRRQFCPRLIHGTIDGRAR